MRFRLKFFVLPKFTKHLWMKIQYHLNIFTSRVTLKEDKVLTCNTLYILLSNIQAAENE